jgi:hypothetical protein
MPVAQGNCPNCGAPIDFGVGSSLAKVCEYCRATVHRTDRGLENLGRMADLAATPSLIAVGDEGTLGGRPIRVFGRVQLDHGAGPWDEYYVAFDHGQSWGWLAYAEGNWHVTSEVPGQSLPHFEQLRLELDIPIAPTATSRGGTFRVAELKTGRIVSAEGELPVPFKPGTPRVYADLSAENRGFATIDYGDGTVAPSLFVGWSFAETELVVAQLGPRSANKVKLSAIKCPNCGGELPSLSGERAERLGCPYCGAVSDIAAQKLIAQQELVRSQPDLPLGTSGHFDGIDYLCIAYLRRGSNFDGEQYTWEEYLLWTQRIGFRWLVKDPEAGWSWVVPVNVAEIELRGFPGSVGYARRRFSRRNQNVARVEYVLGEVYWKCQVGETTRVTDFVVGRDVLSREEAPGEVRWSLSSPVPWEVIAHAFKLPVSGAGSRGFGTSSESSGDGWLSQAFTAIVIAVLVIGFLISVFDDEDDYFYSSGSRGGGIFVGGK